MNPKYNTKDTERFWSKVEITDDLNECWLWKASLGSRGYGQFKHRGKVLRSHKVAWEIANERDVYNDLWVLHSCDNPICCNPHHLFLGTAQDNTDDMIQKGRQCFCGNKKRSDPSNAKLSHEIANEIRKRYLEGKISQRALAKEYKVDQKRISRITRNEAWKE